jgi:hypothetical protein
VDKELILNKLATPEVTTNDIKRELEQTKQLLKEIQAKLYCCATRELSNKIATLLNDIAELIETDN